MLPVAGKGCVGREGGLWDTDRHSVLHNSTVYLFDSVNMDQMCVFYSVGVKGAISSDLFRYSSVRLKNRILSL